MTNELITVNEQIKASDETTVLFKSTEEGEVKKEKVKHSREISGVSRVGDNHPA